MALCDFIRFAQMMFILGSIPRQICQIDKKLNYLTLFFSGVFFNELLMFLCKQFKQNSTGLLCLK